jgi:hypothetical protein
MASCSVGNFKQPFALFYFKTLVKADVENISFMQTRAKDLFESPVKNFYSLFEIF